MRILFSFVSSKKKETSAVFLCLGVVVFFLVVVLFFIFSSMSFPSLCSRVALSAKHITDSASASTEVSKGSGRARDES